MQHGSCGSRVFLNQLHNRKLQVKGSEFKLVSRIMDRALKSITNIRGKLNMRECVFLHKVAEKVVNEFGENSLLCEIGSFCGKSTISIASALVKRKTGILYAIDWHKGSPEFPGYGTNDFKSSFDEYITNLKRFKVSERVITIKTKSSEAINKVPDKIQFLWIDGSHSYQAVKADFENYHPKLVKEGYLLFHDACWTTWTEPFRLISERVLDNEDYNLYALIGNTMVFRKEKNKRSKFLKDCLRKFCVFVSGENRPLYKRSISYLLFKITTYYTHYIYR